MSKEMLDIYTDYLICQNKYATATGLADMLDGNISHDKVSRLLRQNQFDSKNLWAYVKPTIRKHERTGGVLILDDCIEEKPYTDENPINCWHYSHAKGTVLKGINLLSCMVRYDDVCLPVGYEVIKKDIKYVDPETQRNRRKSSITKNQLFRQLIDQAHKNDVLFDYVLADNWFGSKANMSFLTDTLKKSFIIGIKSNRTLALSENDALRGQFQRVNSLELEEDMVHKVWLKGLTFPVNLLIKKFKNENGHTGILYLVSNDLTIDADRMYQVYQKRWKIEEFHKSIKQNASLAKSPTKKEHTQRNHIFASVIAYCKLEFLNIKQSTNHFAIKYKLIVRANQVAYQELQKMMA